MAKILITNQVRWRHIFLRDLKERLELLEKLIEIDIYRTLFEIKTISYNKYYDKLESIDPYF